MKTSRYREATKEAMSELVKSLQRTQSIDEIETRLHVELQKKIVPILME